MATRPETAKVRDALLDAAGELIPAIGYAEMSHADVTAFVGIGRTTFYEHFASKEQLLVDLVARDLPPMVDEIIGQVDDGLGPAERLMALAEAMVRFVGTDHLGLILHTEVPRLSPEAQTAIRAAHEGLTAEFAGTYMRGVAEGVFRSGRPPFMGRMMESIIMTGGKLVMDADDPAGQADIIARETAELLVAALSA